MSSGRGTIPIASTKSADITVLEEPVSMRIALMSMLLP